MAGVDSAGGGDDSTLQQFSEYVNNTYLYP